MIAAPPHHPGRKEEDPHDRVRRLEAELAEARRALPGAPDPLEPAEASGRVETPPASSGSPGREGERRSTAAGRPVSAETTSEGPDLALALADAGAGSFAWSPAVITPEHESGPGDDRIELSDSYWRMMGLEPGALPPVGAAWIDRIHPDDLPRFAEAVERCHRGDAGGYRLVLRMEHAGGGHRHFLTTGRVQDRTPDGRVSRVAGILFDVDALKTLELELQAENDRLAGRVARQESDLEESEERFERLAEQAGILLWTAGPDDGDRDPVESLWMNDGLRALLGDSEETGGGRAILREAVMAISSGQERSPAGDEAEQEAEREIVDGSGRRRWLLVRGHARKTRDGRVLGLVGTVEDVTERRESRKALRRLKDELEATVADRTAELVTRVTDLAERNAELDRFTHIASHDLRSPIRTVSAFTGLAAATLRPGSEEAGYLERVRKAGDRMSELLDSLLAFASVGRGRLATEPVDLEASVQDAMEDLTADIEGQEVELAVEPLPRVEGDPALLRHLLMNLLGNAIKYCGEWPPKILVTGEILPAEPRVPAQPAAEGRPATSGVPAIPRRVAVRVADDGIGFDPERADSLFDPFVRGVSEGVPGSGVGLSIVRRVAERHGGRVRAGRDEVGTHRTWFEVELPLQQPVEPAAVPVPGIQRG